VADESDVRDNTAARRFELRVSEEIAFLEYRDRPGGARVLTHTQVPVRLQRRGFGSRLVKAALDEARAHGRLIVPACPFVAAYIERHSEYEDLVVA
jgi:uncharacterized protein